MYCYNLIQALPQYRHHVIIRRPNAKSEVFTLLQEAGAEVRMLPRGQDLIREIPPVDIVIDHTTVRFPDEPSAQTHPNIHWIKVCHGPRLWSESVPYHDYVAVTAESLKGEIKPRTHVCHGCVDTSRYATRNYPCKQFVVGRYGSDRPEKFAPDFPQLMRALHQPLTHFFIVGGQQYKDDFVRLGLAPHASFVEPSVHGKYAYLRAMDAAIYRNAANFVEGFSVSIVELMAAGVPVVAEDRGGNREQVRDGVTGFLVPWDDTDRFISRLRWLRDHPQDRYEMGRRAQEIARTSYDLSNMREEWSKVLEPAKP